MQPPARGYKRAARRSGSRSAHLNSTHGEHTDRPFERDTRASPRRTRMVFTAAQLSGHGLPVPSEEETVVEMIGRYLSQLTSPGRRASSARRGSVESCDEKDNSSLCKLLFFFPLPKFYTVISFKQNS